MSEAMEPIWSESVRAGRVSYFLDVKESSNGRVFLSMAQSTRAEDESWKRDRIIIFEDALPAFRRAVLSAMKVMGREADDRRREDLVELRKTHPRAFEKWCEADDELLRSSQASGMPVERISDDLGRTVRAVTLRLQKLGLAEPEAPGPPG